MAAAAAAAAVAVAVHPSQHAGCKQQPRLPRLLRLETAAAAAPLSLPAWPPPLLPPPASLLRSPTNSSRPPALVVRSSRHWHRRSLRLCRRRRHHLTRTGYPGTRRRRGRLPLPEPGRVYQPALWLLPLLLILQPRRHPRQLPPRGQRLPLRRALVILPPSLTAAGAASRCAGCFAAGVIRHQTRLPRCLRRAILRKLSSEGRAQSGVTVCELGSTLSSSTSFVHMYGLTGFADPYSVCRACFLLHFDGCSTPDMTPELIRCAESWTVQL